MDLDRRGEDGASASTRMKHHDKAATMASQGQGRKGARAKDTIYQPKLPNFGLRTFFFLRGGQASSGQSNMSMSQNQGVLQEHAGRWSKMREFPAADGIATRGGGPGFLWGPTPRDIITEDGESLPEHRPYMRASECKAPPPSGNSDGGSRAKQQPESPGHEHLSNRSPWLRAALLGANDGLVSVASLMAGVGAVRKDVKSMLISGLAGLVAGACSMAIGEYVSVFSQRDAEMADIEKERQEHAKGPVHVARELEELTRIYEERGLTYSLAKEVAMELSKGDVIKVHARDELGINVDDLSNPLQAAFVSAMSFLVGGLVPFLSATFVHDFVTRLSVLIATSSAALLSFGALGAFLGGAPILRAAVRVLLGGWMALLVTFGMLKLFGSAGL